MHLIYVSCPTADRERVDAHVRSLLRGVGIAVASHEGRAGWGVVPVVADEDWELARAVLLTVFTRSEYMIDEFAADDVRWSAFAARRLNFRAGALPCLLDWRDRMNLAAKVWHGDESEPVGLFNRETCPTAPLAWFREDPPLAAELFALELRRSCVVHVLDDRGGRHTFDVTFAMRPDVTARKR